MPSSSFLEVAVDAAKKGGQRLRAGRMQTIEVAYKGVRDVVTNVDHASEAVIVRTIRRHFPSHQIVAEEGSGQEGDSPYRWWIDPLDGTTNYSHGFPFYAVSIALEVEGVIRLGVVYDPLRRECFIAEAGGPSTLNSRPIHVSPTTELSRSLLVTGFPYDIQTNPQDNLDHFSYFSRAAQAVRRTGSAALDLCYVAAGRSDGFWERNLKPWDTAAGSLIVTQAGGSVSRFSGGKYEVTAPDILATNSHIHAEMVRHFGSCIEDNEADLTLRIDFTEPGCHFGDNSFRTASACSRDCARIPERPGTSLS
jgi:myo-inositol-1(or 4)-monophosphatase